MGGTQIIGPPCTEDMPAPAAFGKYRVVAALGAGGFGQVWRCHDEALGREVAVKALAAQARGEPEMRERFLREARSLARVSHPCVVQIFDVGEDDGVPFFVMELVVGRDLEKVVKEGGPLQEHRALNICRAVVTGLQAAAASGVIHRDVKPANILVAGDPRAETVKITDFGLAFPSAQERGRLTAPTTILGTPDYIAPEQARGEEVDIRADMYALGCSLYELLTSRPVFPNATPQATVAAQLAQAPDPPRVYNPDITVATNNLIIRLLAKDPAGRFSTYDELLAAIDHALGASVAPPGPARVSTEGLHAMSGRLPFPGASTSGNLEAVQTENLASCFVDLPDFQERTRQQTRDENQHWTQRFSDGMKSLIRQRGGRFIKQAYGTVLCTFNSPTDAVLFGMSAVDATWEWGRGKPELMNYALRVGINLGEVRLERGDVFGDPVNVAARVMAKAQAGEVWFSDSVYLAMNRSEVEAESTGSHELKGVPVPVRLFKALPRKGHVPSEKSPPFGVRGHGTAEAADALQALEDRARAVVTTVGKAAEGARKVGRGLEPAVRLARGVVRVLWERVPIQYRRTIAIGLPALAIVVTAAIMIPRLTDPYRKEIALLDEGKAGAAARALETKHRESPRAHFLYAKALILSGDKADGLDELDEALAKDATLADPDALSLVVAAMNTKNRDVEKIVVKHFGRNAASALLEQLASERFHTRHHAANALKDLGLQQEVDWVELGLKDVRSESECGRRRDGVRMIEDVGDERALSAIGALRNDPGRDLDCIADALNGAERRLRKKLQKKE